MKIPLPSPRRKARIEIIPLIDIVFFLLATFVMVSLSMVKNQSISVNLPRASTAAVESRDLAVTVTVSKEGIVYLNKEKISVEGLVDRLKKEKGKNPDLRVFIQGDEQANFGQAVHVLDEMRRAGIQKVAIQTRSKE